MNNSLKKAIIDLINKIDNNALLYCIYEFIKELIA